MPHAHLNKQCEHCRAPFAYKPSSPNKRYCSKRCGGLAKTELLEVRLLSHIVKSADPSGCWEWNAARQPTGYGLTKVGKKRGLLVHRVMWELTNGPIPEGICVLHHCDNPPCCNIAHLFLGTKKDNAQDALQKGRLFQPWVHRNGRGKRR